MVEKQNVRMRRMNDGISQTDSEWNRESRHHWLKNYNCKSYNEKKVTVILTWWRVF